jgi:endonuclease/exonuclease/phosphatase family metal-dependent hydrolase
MKPAMSALDEQDIVLLQRINRHPLLRARVESLLGVVEDTEGDLEKADAAERRVIEELRQMGNEVLTEWAQGGVEKCAVQAREEADVRSGGKKTLLAYDLW